MTELGGNRAWHTYKLIIYRKIMRSNNKATEQGWYHTDTAKYLSVSYSSESFIFIVKVALGSR